MKLKKDKFRDSQVKQIQTENEESLEPKVLKQKQHCLAAAAAVVALLTRYSCTATES